MLGTCEKSYALAKIRRTMPFLFCDMHRKTFRLFQISRLYEIFANLHCVERSSLANLIAREPECQTVGIGKIFTETTHVNIVLVGSEEGHGIFAVLGIVHESYSLGCGNGFAGFVNAYRTFGFNPNAFAVGTQRRHTHAGGLVTTSLCIILRVSLYIFISSFV